MSLLDKNKIFFSLIHYILSEQKNVNWILKTSLIDFTGISSLLEEKPYKKEPLLDDVIDYVVNIKPYHVQFSRYFEHYETASETINIPKNDKLETTIHHRFDAIQTTPDINKMFETEEEWLNEQTDLEDGNYYISSTNTYYTIKNGNIEPTFDKESFINAHLANRLFYLGIHDLDELKKELNANFKGLEINGHTFNIGEFGYELFNYDTNEYDSPTIVYDYCLINPTEEFEYFKKSPTFKNSYTKSFEKSGEHRFNLPNIDASGKIVKIFRQPKNQEPYEIDEYELKLNQQYGNYIEIYSGLMKSEKLIIGLFEKINENTDVEDIVLSYAYVFVGYPFIPSTSDVLKREFIELVDGDIYLESPLGELDTNKIVIQKQEVDGSKKAFTNYRVSGPNIVVNSQNLKEDEHIIITSFDYKYLYDKIYMWEDSYGRSHNIINLDGNNFLRARYESDRPREMVASTPLSSFMAYRYNDDDLVVYYNDYKNDFIMGNYDNIRAITITNLTYKDEDETIIDSIQLSQTNSLEDAPNKILINSEIIEYNELDRDTNTIKKLKRGIDGSVVNINATSLNNINKTHSIGDVVLPYIEEFWYPQNRDCKYVSYFINNPKQLTYNCPSGLGDNSYVTVKTINKISLMSDVTENSKTINIDSCNVVPPQYQDALSNELTEQQYNGEFYLKINNDNIPFTTIYKDIDDGTYHITNFTLPSKYKNYGDKVIYSQDDSQIYGCIPFEFMDYEVSLVSIDDGYKIEQEDEIFVFDEMNQPIYRIAGNILYDMKDADIGIISNNTIYKNDGEIMAKIIDDRFYNIHPIIVLDNGLEKGTILQIKIESVNPNE